MKKIYLILTVLALLCLPSASAIQAYTMCSAGTGGGGGGLTAFSDTFTDTNGAALSSTHWATSSATIQSNKAMLSTTSSLLVQGNQDITYQATTSIKADFSINGSSLLTTGDYSKSDIWIQNSASVGTGNNAVKVDLTVTCTDGDGSTCYTTTYTAALISNNSSGSSTTHTSISCTATETLEIRFTDATTVHLYKGGTQVGTGYTTTATLGTTGRVAMYAANNIGLTVQNTFDNFIVAVL